MKNSADAPRRFRSQPLEKFMAGGEKFLSCINTVESLFRGHPSDRGKRPLNRGVL